MANYMIVRQRVTDLTRFQTTFDRLKPDREAAGLTDLGQFCAADEPDVVIVVMEVEDISRAKEYWHSDVLAQGRTEASTLVYSAHDELHNDAIVLRDLVLGRQPNKGNAQCSNHLKSRYRIRSSKISRCGFALPGCHQTPPTIGTLG